MILAYVYGVAYFGAHQLERHLRIQVLQVLIIELQVDCRCIENII